jgi:hypothetical protein
MLEAEVKRRLQYRNTSESPQFEVARSAIRWQSTPELTAYPEVIHSVG